MSRYKSLVDRAIPLMLSAVSVLGSSTYTVATDFRCGTQTPEQTTRAEIRLRERIASATEGNFPCLMVPLHIGVIFKLHIIRNSDGSGGLQSVQSFDDCLRDANTFFHSTEISLEVGPYFIRDLDVLYHDDTSLLDIDSQAEGRTMHETYGGSHIDVYIVNTIYDDFAGFAQIGPDRIEDAYIVYRSDCFDHPIVMAHEIGHILSLHHTHETRFGTDCSQGMDGSFKGDLVPDTPADPNLSGHVSSKCEYDDYARYPEECGTKAGSSYHPLVDNIMSYSSYCRDSFTELQACRMRWYIFGMLMQLAYGTQTVSAGADMPEGAQSIHRTIAEAVAAAASGDYIVIEPGIYPEHLIIDKQVNLVNGRPLDGVVLIGSNVSTDGAGRHPLHE